MHCQRHTAFLCWIACALAAIVSACANEVIPATALVVSVKSDLQDLAAVELAVFEETADPSKEAPEDGQIVSIPAGLTDLPLSIVVNRGDENEVVLAVRGLDAQGNRLVEVRSRVRFASEKSLAVPVFLGEFCRGEFCDLAVRETCYVETTGGVNAGTCGPIPLLRASDLDEISQPGDEHDWSEPNAGSDQDSGGPEDEGGVDSEAGTDGGGDGDGDGTDGDTCREPRGGECGLVPQCGCGDGQACRPTETGSSACGTAGTTPAEAACTSDDECPAGYGCSDARCAAYCTADEDCGAGGACVFAAPTSPVGVCLVPCEAATGTPCGAGTVCADLTGTTFGERTLAGSYCWTPAVTCPSQDNGVCDDPSGTRLCAEGTDAADCFVCVPTSPPGGSCDLVMQCGCGAGLGCDIDFEADVITTLCRVPGPSEPHGFCDLPSDCPLASTCVDGVCRPYCVTAEDCAPNATCEAVAPGIGVCANRCDPEDPAACALGLFCNTYNTLCWRRQRPCTFTGDGECDEPEGTGLCDQATDLADCCPEVTPETLPENCDLISQCGCGPGLACVDMLSGPTLAKTCAEAGTKKTGERCLISTDCEAGNGCVDRVCTRYCNEDSDCDTIGILGGRCIRTNWEGQNINGLKVCLMNCDPDSGRPCAEGSVCLPSINACWVPLNPCSTMWLNDGQCDEPEGTRLCEEGTNPLDCPSQEPAAP